MTGRSTTFGDEGAGFFHRLRDFFTEMRAGLSGGRIAHFSALAPPLPILLAGNPAIAQQLYRGVFAFAGQRIECQPTRIFELKPPSAAWSGELLGFAWLSHLEAPGLALYGAFARHLILAWAARRRRTSLVDSCRRLISFSRHASFILAGASAEFEARFLQLATRETRRLAALRPRDTRGRLLQSIALLAAGLAFRGGGSLRQDALTSVASIASTVFLADGGPFDRSPRTLLDLLVDLVPLRAAMEAQRIAVPYGFHAAMERALPMLRMLCHGDGGLAVFHGVERTQPAMAKAVLEHDAVQGQPLSLAAQSRYCRIAQDEALVIADCGPSSICDSALAIEFSHGAQRIVGSCGVPVNASPEWLAAARSAAAHSTLQLEDGCHRGEISANLIKSPEGTLVKARNASGTLTHIRELFLGSDGCDFRGEDRIEFHAEEGAAANFALRFHLHPSVKASANRKGAAIILLLPNKSAWQFSARGGVLTLEDSIYLAGSGPRHSRQIVIRGSTKTAPRINWAFRKVERPAKSSEVQSAPRLPF